MLEQQNLPVGVVGDIRRRGWRRTYRHGRAMPERCRWRCGATRWRALPNASSRSRQFCKADSAGLVGTVGAITALPGATNVIPGKVSFTLELARLADAHRKLAVADIVRRIESDREAARVVAADRRHLTRTARCPARHG